MHFAALLLSAFAAIALHAQDWAKARLEASPRHREYVQLKRDNRTIQALVVYPESEGKAPVVVLIHEIFGLTDWAKEMADELAGQGFIVIAPDLLSGFGPNGGGSSEFADQDARVKGVSGLDPDGVMADLDAAADYGKKLPAGNGKIAVAGFCWGGAKTFAFAAHRKDLSGGVRVLRDGAGRCFERDRTGVWVLRRQRRAGGCDHSRFRGEDEGSRQEI